MEHSNVYLRILALSLSRTLVAVRKYAAIVMSNSMGSVPYEDYPPTRNHRGSKLRGHGERLSVSHRYLIIILGVDVTATSLRHTKIAKCLLFLDPAFFSHVAICEMDDIKMRVETAKYLESSDSTCYSFEIISRSFAFTEKSFM